jgi:hypothetical protein
MLVRLKPIFALSLLFLFLFPLVEKEVHGLQHVETFHCKASDKHFHEQQHSCPICDFIVPVTVAPSKADYDFSIYLSRSLSLFYVETKAVSSPKYFVSLRAPPIVA